MDNNFMNFRLKLIFLAICILILLAIKGHVKLGYVPDLEKKSIAVAFDYYGAFEKEVEFLVSRLEAAYMELDGIKSVQSVSESGKGFILCMFSDKTSLDKAYVDMSDITANVWADFPEGVSRPSITRSSRDAYPVYISYFPREKEGDADIIKKAYESVPGVGGVELGGRKKMELMVGLHSGRLAGMALPVETLGSKLRSSNLVRKVAMPGGETLVLDSRLSSAADFGRIQVTPGLRLSDVADLDYREADTHSLGHIDGKPALLFFVMKSGEGNTVQVTRELEKVTLQFGGSQLYNLGSKIEKSFIGFSSIILFLFVFLLLNLWLKTKSYCLGAAAICRCIFSLLVSVASVTAAGLQVDLTVMAALALGIIFSFTGGGSQARYICYDFYIQENVSDEKLKNMMCNMKPSGESVDYKKKYYDNSEEKYTVRTYKTSTGEMFDIKVPIKRKPKQHEIDEVHYLLQKGYKIVFLDEPKDGIKHPDLLLNDNLLVELKQVKGNANTAAFNIRKAINKKGVDAPMLFFVENAIQLQNKDILHYLQKDKHIRRNVNYIIIIRNYEQISIMKKKGPGAAFAAAWSNSNINPAARNVNSDFDLKKAFAVPLFVTLFTLIAALYAPLCFRSLVMPFCIALGSGLCAVAVCRWFMNAGPVLRIQIPLWCFSPLLLLSLVLAPVSPVSPFASDVSFSLEYESGTSFPFIKKTALDIEASLLDWGDFDRLILHMDQNRAAFTVIGGAKSDILARIAELSSRYPEIFFYIPEKHTRHAVDVTVYGNNVSVIENNILELAKYVNKNTNNVNIVYNFKSDVANIVLEIPVKCALAGLYPYDVYKTLYYTASEPVVDKYFAGDVETDVKVRGDTRGQKTLAGLLSAPVLSPFGQAGEAGDYITVRKESAQGRIYHRNRMRCLSFSVTGISRAKLEEIVSKFPFSGSCHGEVGQ